MNSFCRFCLLAAACGLLACAPRGEQAEGSVAGKAQSFPMTEVPGMIADAQSRADYLTEHFWDRFKALTGPTDSASVHGIPIKDVEEKFALWGTLLKSATPEVAHRSIVCAVRDARADALGAFMKMADKLLYDPNSPCRNEEAYLSYLHEILSAPLPDESMRAAYEYYLKLCSLNRPGHPASDFAFMTREGRITRLYDIKAPVLLLIFSNPGCPMCARYQENIQKNVPLSEKLSSGDFKVVNIYPDEDVAAWEEYARTYPKEWICGRDHLKQFSSNNLYSLRAIPSLYLLDAEKNVILKDAVYEEVEMKLYDLLF